MLRYLSPIVLSAFLLFLIQPLIGKFILPWFGGTPAVWTTCMLFFQVLLLCGYAYAHASISHLKPRVQVFVHLALLVAALATLPIIPSQTWRPTGPGMAEWRILALLVVTVGLPLFVLSATAPLMQAWFSREHPGVSPYRLYAFSNGASLAGLISYPFLIEPAILLKTQAWAWSAGFGFFALACGWCALRQRSATPQQTAVVEQTPVPPVTSTNCVFWFGWSACGSVVLLATTSQLTQNVAVVPLLWVVPLALYLFTFVICFDNPRWYWRPMWLAALPLAIVCVVMAPFFVSKVPLVAQIVVYCVAQFIACMICHGELARLKPAASRLTGYYLSVAAGGALGGVACSLIAPLVFSGLWEFQCGYAALCLLMTATLIQGAMSKLRLKPVHGWVAVLGIALAVGGCFVVEIQGSQTDTLFASRNFYGVLEVAERSTDKGTMRSLVHGRVTHGMQFQDEALRRTPVAYYGVESGLGVVEAVLRKPDAETGQRRTIRTGAVGLGAGILAAYSQKGDTIRFYEINPEVVRLASEYFSYLSDTDANVEMVEGDARISMEQERAHGESQQFDLLVLDAFSGDAVPLHLLTRQAFALYDYHLTPRGVMAVHISSQHLDMAPLIFGLARDGDKQAVLIDDPHRDDPRYLSSRWVLVTRDANLLKAPEVTCRAGAPGDPSTWLCFSDDYSNLLQLVKKTSKP
jgi:hypothetical protein